MASFFRKMADSSTAARRSHEDVDVSAWSKRGTSVLGCRCVSLSADVSQETPGGCYSRDANEQGEVGAYHAHGESIGASHMAADRLDYS